MRTAPSSILPDFVTGTRTIQVGASSGLVLGANPNRYSIMWWPRSVGAYVVAPSYQVAVGLGFQVSYNNAPLIFTFADLGPVVCADWYGISTAGPFTGYVTECIYQPRRGSN